MKKTAGAFPEHKAYTKGRHADGIVEYTLKSNGLRVLLNVDRSSPVAGVMITYAVGSRNEGVGETGAAHLLEHMMFKGSKKFNKKLGNDAWQMLERVGGKINATTWLDRTNYFEVVAKEHLGTALALEADRMRDAILTAKDFASERTVVLNELERSENEPLELLDVEMWKHAFTTHPYHHPTIGWRKDVETISVEGLRKFYDTYYYPDNATLSVFGDIDPKAVLDEVKKKYGVLPRAPRPITHEFSPEPAQDAPRHVEVSRPGVTNMVGVAYKVPSALHEDAPALHLIASVLGSGRRSRLHLALVEKNLATEFVTFLFPFRDQNMLITYAFAAPGVAHEKLKAVIMRECAAVVQKGITPVEHKAAQARVAADMAFSRDGVYAALQSVGTAAALGDWTWYVDFPRRITETSAATCKRVASRYFTDTGLITGYFKAKK